MSLVDIIIAAVVFFGGGILVNLLFNELLEWQPRFRNWCLRQIVRRLPKPERATRLEEWAAHMNECPGTFSKLFLVLGFWWAARSITKASKAGQPAQAEGTSQKTVVEWEDVPNMEEQLQDEAFAKFMRARRVERLTSMLALGSAAVPLLALFGDFALAALTVGVFVGVVSASWWWR